MESSFVRLMNVFLENNVSSSDEKSTYLPFRSREASQVLYRHHLHLRSSSFAPNNSTLAANTGRLALKASSRCFSLPLGLGQRRYLERIFTGFMDSFLYFGKGRRPPRMEERRDDGALLSPQPPEPPPPTYKPGSLSPNSNSTRMAFIELFRSEQRPRAPQITAILRTFFPDSSSFPLLTSVELFGGGRHETNLPTSSPPPPPPPHYRQHKLEQMARENPPPPSSGGGVPQHPGMSQAELQHWVVVGILTPILIALYLVSFALIKL